MEQEAPDVAVQVRRAPKKRARSSYGPASRRAVVRMKNWGYLHYDSNTYF